MCYTPPLHVHDICTTCIPPPPRHPLQKFLLFDVIFHEQLNKQRRALMFYLDLAMRLERTLVLPRARRARRARPILA